MTDDERALLRAVIEAPDDDAPRLVYADFLEETDEPANVVRAEFIRVQCEYAQLPPGLYPRRLLWARQEELFAEHGHDWLARLPALPGVQWGEHERGFVEWVAAQTPQAFIQHGDVLFEAAPIRGLRFGRLNLTGVRDLARYPLLARVRALYLHGQRLLGDAGAEALAGSPFVAGLRLLHVGNTGVGERGIRALAASPHLAGLTHLYLAGNDLSDDAARALAESPHLGGLESLAVLRNCYLSDEAQGLLRGRFGPALR